MDGSLFLILLLKWTDSMSTDSIRVEWNVYWDRKTETGSEKIKAKGTAIDSFRAREKTAEISIDLQHFSSSFFISFSSLFWIDLNPMDVNALDEMMTSMRKKTTNINREMKRE